MTDFKFLDSSIWISYFFDGLYKEIIDGDNALLVSSLSLFEIKKKLIKEKISNAVIEEQINFVKRKCVVIFVSDKIAELAAEISSKNELHTADSIVYSTALLSKAELYTLDNDFRGLKNVVVFG